MVEECTAFPKLSKTNNCLQSLENEKSDSLLFQSTLLTC